MRPDRSRGLQLEVRCNAQRLFSKLLQDGAGSILTAVRRRDGRDHFGGKKIDGFGRFVSGEERLETVSLSAALAFHVRGAEVGSATK